MDAKEVFPTLFETAACINLKERDDRMASAQKEFDRVGLGGKVEFLRVDRHPRGGSYGCFDSHRQIIREAYEKGVERVALFEDDVDFRKGWEQVVLDIKEFMESGTPYDAIFLGSKINWVDEKTTQRVWRVKCCTTHAYIVHREGMKKFLDGNDLFERRIDEINHDMIQMSIWQNMYAHCNSFTVTQDQALGTDNIGWYRDQMIVSWPDEYIEWLQNTIGWYTANFFLPLGQTNLYIRSSHFHQFGFFLPETVDDGRVVVKPSPYKGIEKLVFVFLAMVCEPPHGRFNTFTKVFLPVVIQRFRERLGFAQSSVKEA